MPNETLSGPRECRRVFICTLLGWRPKGRVEKEIEGNDREILRGKMGKEMTNFKFIDYIILLCLWNIKLMKNSTPLTSRLLLLAHFISIQTKVDLYWSLCLVHLCNQEITHYISQWHWLDFCAELAICRWKLHYLFFSPLLQFSMSI